VRCHSASFALLLLLTLPTSACRTDPDPGSDGRHVTADSTYDATEPIFDEGLRFHLAHPGPYWKLLHKQDARNFMPKAVAGATRDGTYGFVLVERMPGVTLESLDTIISTRYPAAKLESEGPTTIGGLPAHRRVFVTTVNGVAFRYVSVSLLRDGFWYLLLAWGPVLSISERDLDPFIAAFSPTEGEIRGDLDARPTVKRADGATWQIRDGHFAGMASSLRLSPVPPWRYLVGRELAELDPRAELALVDERVGAKVWLVPQRHMGGDLEVLADTDMGTRTIAGQEVPLVREGLDGGFERQIALLAGDGVLTQVVSWYPRGAQQAAEASIQALLARLTPLSTVEREALLAELLAREDVLARASTDSAYFGEKFHDFEHQITWARPNELYEVQLGDAAPVADPNAVLWLRAPLLGIEAKLSVVEREAPRTHEHHEAAVAALENRRDEPMVVDGVAVQRTFGTRRVHSTERHVAVLSAAHQGHAVIFSAEGSTTVSTVAPAIDAALAGLGLPAKLPATEVVDGRFVDHRYGVSVDEPAGGWVRDTSCALALIGSVCTTKWSREQSTISLYVATGHSAQEGDEVQGNAWATAFFEQRTRDAQARITPSGEPILERITLDGVPSRRLVYPRIQHECARHRGRMVSLTTYNVSEEEAERFRSGFRWEW
jgi:hypothetical protein